MKSYLRLATIYFLFEKSHHAVAQTPNHLKSTKLGFTQNIHLTTVDKFTSSHEAKIKR